MAHALAALGLNTAERILELPGEIVSGHPDRHVLRVEIPGLPGACYLKRQHIVTRRERFRNWRAGFGWVSRSQRERSILAQLEAAGLPAPRWLAVGEDGRGRSFLLVEGIESPTDLRALLRSTHAPAARARLAGQVGDLIGRLHRAGFTTPDLTAKHLLVSGDAVIPIDWQNARRVKCVSAGDRIRALAALDASLAPGLATTCERLRVLHGALRPSSAKGPFPEPLSTLARRVAIEAQRLAVRPSMRDQRGDGIAAQRLVWVAGEAVCAVPDVAAIWPAPATGLPFYGAAPGEREIALPDGRPAHLIRGRSLIPFGRLRYRLGGKPWRSPGSRLGRILFHLERHGIPAPRLLAFGHRAVGIASVEWFALHTPAVGPLASPTADAAEQMGECLRQLHDAGCRPAGDIRRVFAIAERISVRDVTAIRLVRTLTRRQRLDDLARLALSLPRPLRAKVRSGYGATAVVGGPPRDPAMTTSTKP
jgi:hypothetical protein